MKITRFALLTMMNVVLIGCTGLTQYRTQYAPCVSADLAHHCANSAIEEYQPPDANVPSYLLGFIEFDDQGQLFDRAQVSKVLEQIDHEINGDDQDAIMVVFVHGWKNNAQSDNGNVDHFRSALARLDDTEQSLSRAQRRPKRKIIGIYLGWRGASITAPVLKELTFWDRKNTAHKVGHGEVTEVLNRLDLIRRTKDAEAPKGHSNSRLVVIGHSFGGAVVYSAVAQILESRFINTVGPDGTSSDVEGFGNLVVLINPAFEAQLFTPLSDLSTERGTYFNSQLPVLAILTSEADSATGTFFPIGRWVSTRFEKERTTTRWNPVSKTTETIKQSDTNILAVGHYSPYKTHDLRATTSGQVTSSPKLNAEESARSVQRKGQEWEDDKPGSAIQFPGALLTRTMNSAGRNPYLVVNVDKKLIPNHSDIWDPSVGDFISHLILISSQSNDPVERASQRTER